MDVSQLRNGNLPLSAGGWNQHAAEGIEGGAKVAHIADIHGITFPAFDGTRDVLASDGALDDGLGVVDT